MFHFAQCLGNLAKDFLPGSSQQIKSWKNEAYSWSEIGFSPEVGNLDGEAVDQSAINMELQDLFR